MSYSDTNPKRAWGFYWVLLRRSRLWLVAKWSQKWGWSIPEGDECQHDSAFAKIDERRIVRPVR